ncbi:MAG TPA: GTPase Era [Humidesulfovibrio sp.]|uniref:GTPase Era n=1 Tax=Humidesulfovibrio sp. TaxID=2910988 RepID=UPI002C6DB30A|nr:GTPase Era [Humidesulfovibrio sp.]HWR03845.1 GTPase Era [Humidesulfovibrio sp.]
MTTHRFGHVALMGPPNAGKSTLLNRLMGQKLAIVSPKPQTTRNAISGIHSTDDAQIVFLDTPGVHRMAGRMNRLLLEAAWGALHQADAVVIILDVSLYAKRPQLFDSEIRPLTDPVGRVGKPVFIAANKVDQIKPKEKMLPLLLRIGQAFPQAEVFPISAATGEGVDDLLAALTRLLPEGPAQYPEDQLSTASIRFMAAETIREKLFLQLEEELPYNTIVEIEQWEEPEEGQARINACIHVARNNHKGMVIGKGGQMLKKIGSAARIELEALLERPVHLELWVKVREDWTEDTSFLREMGLGE